jgi:DNA-binding transcriptional LysR family regulator
MDKSYKYFIGIVQAGNISKAAKKLRISQPALSASLKNLESQLKTELLVRSRLGITLTRAGKAVYKHALNLDDIEKNLHTTLQETIKRDAKLEIGAIDSIALELVSQVDTKKDFTHITVDNTSRLIEHVKNGQLDVAYTTQPSKKLQDLKYIVIAQENMIAIASSKKTGSYIPLLAYNAGSNTYRIIQNTLKDRGLDTKIIMHSTDPYLLIEAARLGMGVAIIPYNLFANIDNSNLIQVYKKLKIYRPIVKVSRQNRYLPQSLQKFEAQIIKSLNY